MMHLLDDHFFFWGVSPCRVMPVTYEFVPFFFVAVPGLPHRFCDLQFVVATPTTVISSLSNGPGGVFRYLFMFTPILGEIIQFDYIIFFKWVVQPPTSYIGIISQYKDPY